VNGLDRSTADSSNGSPPSAQLPEEALLFDEPRAGLGGAWRRPIVGRSAQPRDGGVGVQMPQLLTPDALQVWGRILPGLDPLSSAGNLLGSPRLEC
jgi:hypothetical protein